VAISPVSEEGAIANLDAEAPGWDFDGMRVAAKQQWSEALGARFKAVDQRTVAQRHGGR